MSFPAIHTRTSAERRLIATSVALLTVLVAMLPLAAAEPPHADRAAEDTLSAAARFRRVYVPEDQIEQWPRHGERYVPMDAAEFERFAAKLGATAATLAIPSAKTPELPPNVEVVRAVYEAQLAGDVLSGGQATLQIRHAAKGAALLRMDSCRLPIESPRWLEESASTKVGTTTSTVAATPQAATVGVGADGKLSLRVEQSGTLQFDWSLVGHRETGTALVFELGLPPASSNELRLALPPDLVPTVEQGFSTLVAADKSDTNSAPANVAASATNKISFRHWDIELGGQTRVVVRLARHDFLRESRPLTLVRQSLVYDFSPRGMQLSAELKLDVLGEPIQRIALLVDQPLALVTARYGGSQLPWFEVDAAGKKIAAADSSGHRGATLDAAGDHADFAAGDRTGIRRIVLELPEPLHGTGRVVRLGFVAPLNPRGRLPTVRPADDGIFWQEGSASLLVPLPLEFDELTLQGCRQTKAEPLPAPAVGDAIALQYFRPDADVNIALARRGERLQMQSGTMIDVRGGTMTGRCLLDVTAQDGECFKLSADVSPSWIIDSIESVPADGLADWSYSARSASDAQLDITLAKSIRPEEPLRLVVSGRWRRAPRGEQLRPNDLEMVTLRDVHATRRLAAVRAAAPFRLQATGAEELRRLDPTQLTPSDAALLGGGPIASGTLVLIDDEAARNLAVTLANETPLFAGTVHLDAEVADTSLTEAYRFHCKPESAELDRLLVHFSRRREEPIRWSLAAEKERANSAFSTDGAVANSSFSDGTASGSTDLTDQLSARRLSAPQQAALGLASGGEVWELLFRHAGSRSFDIQAVRISPLSADTPLSLAELVQASEQQGSVSIWAVGRRIPQINNRRLRPTQINPAVMVGSPGVTDSLSQAAEAWMISAVELAAYQYDPVEEIVSAAVDPTASLMVSPGKERSVAWAWSCRLDSYFSPDGSSQHVGCWSINNTGRTRVRFRMPPGAIFQNAWVDDALCAAGRLPIDTASARATASEPSPALDNRAKGADHSAATIDLELPAGQRFVRVVLQWSSNDEPLSILSSRTSQLPEIDMTVMARQWHVWLPPRFRLSNPESDSQSAFVAPVSWSQRLFGPFGKPVGETAVNPFRSDEWSALVRDLANRDPAWLQARQIIERLAQHARSGARSASAVRSNNANKNGALKTVPPLPVPTVVSRDSGAASVTWGELLADVQSETTQSFDIRPLPLMVDTRALADIGLSARSAVGPPSSETMDGWPLVQADLVLLIDPRAIVLTSRSAAAVWSGPFSTADGVLLRAPVGPFESQLRLALAGNSERFVPVELWNFPDSKSPWTSAPRSGDTPAIDHAGWIVYDLDFSETPRRIGVVDRNMMYVMGCGLFLLTVLLVFAKGDISWKHRGIVLASATAIALLLPGSCSPLGAGLWMGLTAGWTLRGLAVWDRPLGAYSRRLLAAAAGIRIFPAVIGDSPSMGPTSNSDDRTLSSNSIGNTGSAEPPSSGSSSMRKRGGPMGPNIGLLLLLGCVAWHDAGAAEPQADEIVPAPAKSQAGSGTKSDRGASGDDEKIPEVLIPIDDQQHFKGKVYFVPERLYRELVRSGARPLDVTSKNWLITGAAYEGGLKRQENTGALDTTDWKAIYDLDVLTSPAHVWIPLGNSGTNLLPDGVRLDAQPIQFQWESNEGFGVQLRHDDDKGATAQRGIGFDISAIGHHTLELAFRPTPQVQGGATTLEFAILPLATSRLELSIPADTPIELPGALGQTSLDRAHNRLTAVLGPIDQLTVRGWSDPLGGEVKPPVVDADELYWLKVRPGSVVLEARFNVRVAEGRLTQMRLLEDPRLRRLPLEAGSPISDIRTEEGDLHTIYVGLSQAVVDRTTFKLSFLLTDTSGIGNLRLPKLDLLGVRSENRRLAVSVEAPLEFDLSSAAPATPAATLLPAAQFLSAWGSSDAKPQLAYKLSPGETTWNLPIHSRQPQLESREQLAIAIDRGQLHETWLADLTVVGGTLFQIQVPAPPQWVVEQATFRQDGAVDQPVRWARSPGGNLTLFLPGPVPEHSQLLLRGSMPFLVGTVTNLPELRVKGPSSVKIASQSTLLLSGADVQVAVTNPAGMQPSSQPALQSIVDRALADGLLDRDALRHLRPTVSLSGHALSGATPAIRIVANSPQVEGKETTTIARANDVWNAAVDLDLNVSGGVLDGLRFDLPPQWSAPTEITPNTPSQLIDVPGESRRQLVLRPAEPWAGPVHLHLSGPIVTLAGQRVRVPDVRPLGVAQLHRYVELPTRSGEQNLSWEASGLNFEPLPKRFSPESSLDLYRICEVVADHFEATLKSVEKTIGQPRVRLADIAVAFSENGRCYGTATLDLEPAGALNCLLELAPNEHLIHVRTDGLATAARPVGNNHWSVALGDGKLPQQVEIVFTADLPDESQGNLQMFLSAPVLVDLPVEQTLWSVIAPPVGSDYGNISVDGSAANGGSAVAGAAPATTLQQDLIRLETISRFIESAGTTPAAGPDDPVANWIAPWTHRFQLARSDVERSRMREGATDASRAAELEMRAIDARQKKMARRSGFEKLAAEHTASPPVADDEFELWKQAGGAAQPAAGFYVHGFGPTLSLSLSRRGQNDLGWRILMAIVGVSVVAFLVWLGGRQKPWSNRWTGVVCPPAFFGAATGLFVWLELEPSWLGLVVFSASLGYLFLQRRGWVFQ